MWNVLLDTESERGPLITDQTFIAIAVIGLMLIAGMIVFGIVFWAGRFQKELKHINQRIMQATSDREREHYIRRRKQLYLSVIPFVRYNKKSKKHRHHK